MRFAAIAERKPGQVAWRYLSHDGFDTASQDGQGGLAVNEDYVFATDWAPTYNTEQRGIVRFRMSDGSAVRFADAVTTIDLTLGLNGLLYVLAEHGKEVSIYDPVTMSLIWTVTLAEEVRGIAVSQDGVVYGTEWHGAIYEFSDTGDVAASHDTGQDNTFDIDLAPDGTIAVGSRFGSVYLSDRSLSGSTRLGVGTTNTFVTFTRSGTM